MTDCSCKDCQSACAFRPGFFRRDQIEPLAAALNLSVPELVRKHLQVDFYSGEGTDYEDTAMLVPRLKGERGGTQIDQDPRGVCHWLINGRCQIHNLGKPAECAELGHGEDGKRLKGDRDAIAATWKGAGEWIEEVTGDYFVPHEAGILSFFALHTPYYPNPDMADPYAEESAQP
jgi:hypothetical protein